jgi:hypothetical protein
MAKTTTKKTAPKGKAKAASKAPVERGENRYLRGAKVIIEIGLGGEPNIIDLPELALKAGMSVATANHVWTAFQGVCEALRDAKLLPARKPVPKKAPTAPSAPEATAEVMPVEAMPAEAA